jgi:hypothetical protein
MAKIYDIGTVRAKHIRLARLKEILGETFNHIAIPPSDISVKEEMDYIFPPSALRTIDELSLGELDDLINGQMKFFILK